MGSILALAGRRIDAPDATPRFPLERVSKVKEKLRHAFAQHAASALVCSAACGSDLLALDAAGELGLRRRVVLPFEAERFRETSVIDRPGPWGDLYDRIVAAVGDAGELVVLEDAGEGSEAYAAATEKIIDEAIALASAEPTARPLAVRVWEGRSRGAGDMTEHFGRLAQERGLPVLDILTLEER
jgi:hypothetical protein